MRTKNESLADARREQILAAAKRVFRARGFHAARMEEICKEAALSPGSMYRHFSSKESIIDELVEREFDCYLALVRHYLGSAEGLAAFLRFDLELLGVLLQRTQDDISIDAWAELARNPRLMQRMAERDAQLRLEVMRALEKAQQRGLIRAEISNLSGLANVLSALVSGLQVDFHLNPVLDQAATAAAAAELLGGYLKP
ncbi:TetR/AcrR family transcriptional regulator [Chitiniphilus purpureus]|uniref:TetR/AcrR family transcriptional regulator n=1 Tax=Chitiniphilus purpureus TaxID=2981137 RepID=A0ABY6DM96_9NEIS|nr:TetR/AcrR family transcriptional regulator [Chitiniphilus sp. CD1]UXY15479.1 TetR/AcrR family transcriptional regulator [Chitiniphilus sp. CD1]